MKPTGRIDQRGGEVEEELHKFLSFRIGNENFGVGILRVKEIIEYAEVTPVPMMPEFMRGAINLRGHAIPIIDLSVRLGRGSLEIAKRTCIVVVEVFNNGAKMDIGVTVDAVNEVLDIRPSEIEPPPSLGGSVRTDFLRGMGKVNEKFIILLEMDRVLSVADMNVLGDFDRRGHADSGHDRAVGVGAESAENGRAV